jgi:predicted RNA methylase
MSKTIVLDEPVAAVLRNATVDGAAVKLPPGQLDGRLYVAVDRALRALGGKWNRGAQAHVFAEPIGGRLTAILDAGKVTPPQAFGFYPTPPALIDRLMELADVEPHHMVLEPSAGHGAICDALLDVIDPERLRCVELLPENCTVLRRLGYLPIEGDFMAVDLPAAFDRVVMNPPFERKQDIHHVTRAFSLLKPGGRLVSIMSAGVVANGDAKSRALRALVEAHGWLEHNPEGSFKPAGTAVRTVTVVLDASPAEEGR